MTALKETGSLIKGFSTPDIIAYAARSRFDVQLPGLVTKTWHDLMYLGTHIDAIYDGDYGTSGQLPLDQIEAYWNDSASEPPNLKNDEATEAMMELKTDADMLGLDQKQKNAFLWHSSQILRASKACSRAFTIGELAAARKEEGVLTAQLFLDVVPREAQTQDFTRFANWLSSVAAIAGLLDSFWDLPKDSRQGNIQITPSWAHRVGLLGYAAPELSSAAADCGPGLVGKLAVKACLLGINRSGRFNKFRTH